MNDDKGAVEGAPEWVRRVPWIFMLVVVLPTVLACIYYFLIAAPLYVVQAKFVASIKNSTQAAGGLNSILSTVGAAGGDLSQVTAYEVKDYMTSRGAVIDFTQHAGLAQIMSRPEGDFIYRYPRMFESGNQAGLYKAFGRFATVEYNLQTGISTLTVKAFRAQDAQRLAVTMRDRSEAWVAALNARALSDQVAQAQRQVDDAVAAVAKAQAALTLYRNGARMIDPDKSASADLELLSHLEAQIDALKAQRNAVAAAAPQSPQLPLLDEQIAAFQGQIDNERTSQAGAADSLAPKVAQYQKLMLDSDVAAKGLESAVAGLESAHLDARRQQVFLQRVVNPTLPDMPEEPHRFKMVMLIMVSALLAYGIIAMVISGLREHRQN
jgi:BexC/CtrB/KpsE family polysaccharide export inner-membrane protein